MADLQGIAEVWTWIMEKPEYGPLDLDRSTCLTVMPGHSGEDDSMIPDFHRVAMAVLGLTAAASGQSVRITWVGQACFYVQAENGATVVTDPPAASVGYALPGDYPPMRLP